jgi:diguanylate cyclase (GGDEF)-like protein
MSTPVPLPTRANPKPSEKRGKSFFPNMRSEVRLFVAIAVIVFVLAIVLPTGDWLGTALSEQAYNIDEIIVGVFAVSLVVLAFLLRGWRHVATAVEQMEKRSAVDAQLSQMTSLLHACFTLEEASSIIAHFARQFFPNHSGALHVYRSSRNLLEVNTVWGDEAGNESIFGPQQCWALRQGQIYAVSDPQQSILCGHVHHTRPYICLPMMAHGEVLALLHISPDAAAMTEQELLEPHESVLRVFTERIALALSNLKLRESLRQQSIRDPLTGLFNRRYLEESLSIEIERAKRSKGPFSVIMMDLDHFKRFNDTHGHEAGDSVLQLLGSFLRRHVRSGDVACRYGGEEFTLILPGASLEAAQQRAQELCEGIRVLNVDFKNQILGPLTLSIGIATFPTHGESGDLVLQAADTALYQAKNEGRDRVVVAV